jgi:hypothetical protein
MYPGQIWVSSPKRYPEQHKSWYWLAYQDCGGLYQAPSGKKKMACWKIQLLYLGFFHQFLWIFPFKKPPFTSGIWQ